jgi:hypothetical protein
MALGEKVDCIHLLEVNGTSTHMKPGGSFVDDTMRGVASDDMHADPTLSCIDNLTPEEDLHVVRMEEIIQFFLDYLQVTGGDIAPDKCA